MVQPLNIQRTFGILVQQMFEAAFAVLFNCTPLYQASESYTFSYCLLVRFRLLLTRLRIWSLYTLLLPWNGQ